MADLCSLLCGYPLWAAENAIERVKDTIKFPATRAEIKPLLEDQVRVPKFAAEWERKAQVQIAETEQLMLEGPIAKKLTYEELRAKYDGPNGEPWGITNDQMKRLPTPTQAKSFLVDKIGQEAFDALPTEMPSWKTIGEARRAATLDPTAGEGKS